MFEVEHSEVARADPDRAWALLTDVETWPSWNPGVAQASLEGPFEPGSEGYTRAEAGPRSRLRVVEVDPDARRVVTETVLKLAVLRFEHELTPGDDGLRISHKVALTGPAAPVYRRTVGQRLERSIPAAVKGLGEQAALSSS